ncbi:MAG: molybdopterin-dependent oxidoreductase [Planctomycetaceae bacterium]|nr:molybdopterin-dependent oxidoreductase [Planctomycetaceae bacterium]
MPTVIVNDKPVEIGADEKLNCVQAAQRAGVEIPTYCWHPALSVVASCRMCLIEMGDKKPDGTIAMQPKLFPACQTPVKDGTVIVSNSEKVKQAQKGTLEYLLLNHPLDCPVCDQAGECFLQDYSYRYGRGYTRLQEPKTLKPDKDYIGDQITLFTDRCVMCTRCVRFTREISGTAELQVINRGSHEEIDIFPGEPCNNKLAGNVVDLCPVGALCSKDFLYKQRVWWLQTKSSTCPDCSTGCSIRVDQTGDVVKRLRPRHNPKAQGHFMCDDGRFGWKYIHGPDRLTQPEMRSPQGAKSHDWDAIQPALRAALEGAVTRKASAVAAVLSPWMTVEEAYLLAKWLKRLSPQTRLALGPVRKEGGDDCYPKDVRGKALPNPKFTIRHEKCPNRKGVELILQHFQGSVIPFDTLLSEVESNQVDTLFLTGGDPKGWITESQAAVLGKLKMLAVLDLLKSPATPKAHYVLAGGSFAEKDGTFINHAGLAQAIVKAIRSPENARPDGRILWELSGRRGLFHATNLRREIGQEVPSLAALSVGDLGEHGVLLTERPTVAAPVRGEKVTAS